ncbi:PHP domain-containing protein [bacterium]|nr:PHP domain-containing protein [bacterium]
MDPTIEFVEFFAKTHYSFLEGASSPEELFSTAAMRGYSGLGIADFNGLYGIARAHAASQNQGIPLYIGSQISWKVFWSWISSSARPQGLRKVTN